jgi:hypothetical protein
LKRFVNKLIEIASDVILIALGRPFSLGFTRGLF